MSEGGRTLQRLSHRLQHAVGKQLVVRKDAPDLLRAPFVFSDILEIVGFLIVCEPRNNNHQ